MYPNLEIFGQTIHTYWLCVMVGLLSAAGLALVRGYAVRNKISQEDIVLTILCATTGALFGAKIFQIVGHVMRDGKSEDFWTLQNWKQLLTGAGVYYGALIGGVLAVFLYIRVSKLDFLTIMDVLVPSIFLAHAFGRLGCFFAGCCYGREALWGIALSHALNDAPRVPVQLFEAGFNLLVMAAILIFRPARKRPGILLPLYLIIYAAGRFVLEFFRGDAGRGVYFLSVSQWISLILLPLGVILLFRMKRKRDRYAER